MNPSPHPPRSNLRFALKVLWLLARGFALIFILLLALTVAAIVSFPQLFDSERARQVIVAQLEDILHRPVDIKGVVMSPQGIKLSGVHVYSKVDPSRALLDSDMALVTIKLDSLMRRRLELNTVRLVAPHIKIWRDADGLWSVMDLFPSSGAVHSATVGKIALPVSLAAEQTVIENGILEVDDQLKKTSFKVERFGLSIKRFDFDKPFTLSMRFDNVSRFADKEIHASISLEGSMSLASQNWPEASLKADRLDAKIDGRPLHGSATIKDFTAPTITADLLVPALGPADWQFYFDKKFDFSLPPSRWSAKVLCPGSGFFKVEQLKATAGPVTAAAAGSVDLGGGKPRLDAFVSAAEFPLDALAAFKPNLERFHLKGTASGEAGASGWTDRLIVHRAKVHLRGFSSTLKHSVIEKGDIDATASNDFSNFSATVGRGAMTAFGQPFTDISGSAALVGQDLSLENVAVRWGDSKVKFKAHVTNLSKPKEVALSGNVDKINWEKMTDLVTTVVTSVSTTAFSASEEAKKPTWLQTFKYAIPRKFPDTIGHFHVGTVTHKTFHFDHMDFLWDLHGVTQSLHSVSGDIKVGFGPGRVNDIQAVQESNKFLRIIFLPYIYMYKLAGSSTFDLRKSVPKELDFDRIEGQYTVTRGIVKTDFTHVASAATVVLADGEADLGRETTNMTVLTRLAKVPKALPEFWVDEMGRPSIGFTVKGDLNLPDYQIRLKKIAANEIDRRIAQGQAQATARFAEIEKLKTLVEEKSQ